MLDLSIITSDLLMGSQLVTQEDLALLKSLGVRGVLSLQEDRDLAVLGLRFESIRQMALEHGIDLRRCPIRDIDPSDLVQNLPKALDELQELLTECGRVYVHCTAGINRSAGVLLAFLVRRRLMPVQDALQLIRSRRPIISPYSSLIAMLEQGGPTGRI